ncbi:MAG: proteasome subunit beta, partial [Acidimicrobiia bacterium]|nr:proteasome subunit beta [Acidimicrobiia bacterium]
DVRRGIYPNVVTVTSDGFTEIGEDRVAEVAAEALEARP